MTQPINQVEVPTSEKSNSHFEIDSLPLVSVVIPAYNAEVYIARTLTSVLAQTYPNLEILVVDDGSTDQTTAMVERIARSDGRVILLQQVNAGVAAARNLGIHHAKGEFIALIDADDIWYPNNIEKQVQTFLRLDASVGVVYSWSLDIDESDHPQGGFHAYSVEGNVYLTLICHYFLGNSSSALIRQKCFEKVGNYNTGMIALGAQGCEDWDLYLRIAEFYQYRVVPEFLVGYRKPQESMTRDYASMANSHYWMLVFAQQRNPNISKLLCRLSSSNFYVYLAHQSDRNGDYHDTILWLKRAIQSDPVTPFLRCGPYRLMLSSCIQAITQFMQSSKQETTRNIDRSKQHFYRKESVEPSFPTIKQRIAIRVIDGIVNVFHRLAPILFRASQI